MHCLVVAFDSTHYRESLALRERLLRAPLGLQLTAADLFDEARQIHLGAFEAHTLIGCLLLKPEHNTQIRFRQMAVDTAQQKRGVGSALLRFAETTAAAQGYTQVILHARETARAFYQRNGYQCVGERFEEIGLAHIKMCKPLQQQASENRHLSD